MSSSNNQFLGIISGLSTRVRVLLFIVILIPVYLYYLSGLTTNPPGFYIDEAAVSYNAYTIAQRGEGEFGHKLPLYFPVFPLGPPFYYLGYVEPVQIYALAALNLIFSPSVMLSRGLSATAIFLTALLLGFLARRISGSDLVGLLLGGTALITPWLFEMGRLAFGASLYPFTIALFLYALYRAYERDRWSILDAVLVAAALALSTYTYAVGRLLGPLLAFGLLLFVRDLRRLKGVLLTWAAYAAFLVPMLIYHLRNPDALMGRFTVSVGYIAAEKSYFDLLVEFLGHFAANFSPMRFLFIGDMNNRHHIPETAPVYYVTLILLVAGIAFILLRHRTQAWWHYAIYGLLISAVPASLTKDDFHMLRLSAVPIFILVLTIPALVWLADKRGKENGSWFRPIVPGAVVVLLVLLTLTQALSFRSKFAEFGPTRGGYFDENFPNAFAAAIARPERPIYLVDQAYYHAYWQAVVQGVDLANFVRMEPREKPPVNALVLSSEERCEDCEMYVKDIPYVVYKTFKEPDKPASTITTNKGSSPGQFSKPRGIAVDREGNYYIADTDNGRIEKFNSGGNFVSQFRAAGGPTGDVQPHGVAVNAAGDIFVSDSLNHDLLRFTADGTFVKEWKGPDTGFYGPRDVEIDTAGKVYIVDQGRTRIVRYDPETDESTVWCKAGKGDGELSDPTGIAIGGGFVFVADSGNGRIQIFDMNGNFVRKFDVPELTESLLMYPDVAYDPTTKRIFVSRGAANDILAFGLDGKRLEPVKVPGVLRRPSSMAIIDRPTGNGLLILNTGGDNPESGEPGTSTIELKK